MRSARSSSLVFALAVSSCSGRAVDPSPQPMHAILSGEFRLTQDAVTLPLRIVKEFPLFDAKVNGVAGTLMFDTGNGDALSLNDRAVPLKDGVVIGKGFVGSGQSFEVKRYPHVDSVELAGPLIFRDVRDVKGMDFQFVADGVTPDFLGFVGPEFFTGYRFTLDYRTPCVTFVRDSSPRDERAGASTIAVLPFELRKLPNHPIVKLTIGGIPFAGSFDTGQLGGLNVSAETKARLVELGLLTPSAGDGEPLFDLKGLEFSPSFTASVSGIRVSTDPEPAAAPLGLTEQDCISFGFAFLRQYRSTWDFAGKTIELRAP